MALLLRRRQGLPTASPELTRIGRVFSFTRCGNRELTVTGSSPAIDTSGGAITILDAPTGRVRYSPPPALFDATRSPYVARWRVVDAAARVSFWPNGEADHWLIGF